jgi:hypothetical protein
VLFLRIFSSICGDRPDGRPKLLQGPGGGKNARKKPVRLPRGPFAETLLLQPAKEGAGFFFKGAKVDASQFLKGQSEKRCWRFLGLSIRAA